MNAMKAWLKEKITNYFTIPEGRESIYDFIRVISCFGVIMIHASIETQGVSGAILQVASRTALPMFFLLSGVLVLGSDHEESIGRFYWKRFVSILVPFMLYGIVYTGWVNQQHEIPEHITRADIFVIFREIPNALKLNLQEMQFFHLWFMYAILGFYLVTPFLKTGLRAMSDKMLFSLTIFIIVVMAIRDYLPLINLSIGIDFVVTNWILYYILGYIITRDFMKKWYPFLLIIGFITACLLSVWKYKGIQQTTYFFDLAPHMIVITCGAFAGFMLAEPFITKCKPLNWVMMRLSRYSFSIYLIHGIILFSFINHHPGLHYTAGGALLESFIVFLRCLLFALLYDNIVVFNVQRLLRFVFGRAFSRRRNR